MIKKVMLFILLIFIVPAFSLCHVIDTEPATGYSQYSLGCGTAIPITLSCNTSASIGNIEVILGFVLDKLF